MKTIKVRNTLSVIWILLLVTSNSALAQNNTNYLQVITNTTLNFNVNDANDLENAQTLSNALTIKMMSKAKNCNVSAKISSYTVPAGFLATTSPIKLDFTSTTATNTSYIYSGALTLSSSDQLLFSQNKSGATNYYYYDVIMGPLDYSYGPGNYNFTITFTMVQP